MNVGGTGIDFQRAEVGQAVIVRRSPVPSDSTSSLFLCLLKRTGTPRTANQVLGRRGVACHQVERNHRELQACTTLQKEHLVVAGNCQQITETTLSIFHDGDERLAAVTDFHHRCPTPRQGQQLRAGPFQYRQGKHTWTCREIEYPLHCRFGRHRLSRSLPTSRNIYLWGRVCHSRVDLNVGSESFTGKNASHVLKAAILCCPPTIEKDAQSVGMTARAVCAARATRLFPKVVCPSTGTLAGKCSFRPPRLAENRLQSRVNRDKMPRCPHGRTLVV